MTSPLGFYQLLYFCGPYLPETFILLIIGELRETDLEHFGVLIKGN